RSVSRPRPEESMQHAEQLEHSIDHYLRQAYHLPGDMPPFELHLRTSALLMIDMQYLDAHPEGEFGQRARTHGIDQTIGPFFQRLAQTTVPAAQTLLSAARQAEMNILYTRI